MGSLTSPGDGVRRRRRSRGRALNHPQPFGSVGTGVLTSQSVPGVSQSGPRWDTGRARREGLEDTRVRLNGVPMSPHTLLIKVPVEDAARNSFGVAVIQPLDLIYEVLANFDLPRVPE